jgi:hypothetical protein
MPSMIIIFTLIGITLLIFVGRFYEIFQSKYHNSIRVPRMQVRSLEPSSRFIERKAT